jgi:hypothetical protein
MASALRQHQYPGVGLPLRYLKQDGWSGTDFYRLGSFEGATDCTSDLLPIREVAMMLLMDRLTDKPNWHEKVFNDAIVTKWRDEALTQDEDDVYDNIVQGKNIPMPGRSRIITPAAFDYVHLLSCSCRLQLVIADSICSASPSFRSRLPISRKPALSSRPTRPAGPRPTAPPSRPTRS